jgi:hypothetical protein
MNILYSKLFKLTLLSNGCVVHAILPHTQALEKFGPHIQHAIDYASLASIIWNLLFLILTYEYYVIKLSMDSNGKGVSIVGVKLSFETLVKSILVNHLNQFIW